MRSTTIPFSGFYESDHIYTLDGELEGMLADDSGNPYSNAQAPGVEDTWRCVNWRAVHVGYARRYAERFRDAFEAEVGIKIGLKFDALEAPREYNFGTDRIFCKISAVAVRRMYRACDKAKLDALIRKNFTSRDGFISFYPNSLAEWLGEGRPESWDHNQIGILVECLWAQHADEDASRYLMDDDRCNGVLGNLLRSNMTGEGLENLDKCGELRDACVYADR